MRTYVRVGKKADVLSSSVDERFLFLMNICHFHGLNGSRV